MIAILLSVLQGLAVAAIAFAGLVIAYQQKRLADIKLRNDLFDRRFNIFEAARHLIDTACQLEVPYLADIDTFDSKISDAAFFFHNEILKYLYEVRRHVRRLFDLHQETLDDGEKKDIGATMRDRKATLEWLVGESDRIVEEFKPSMGLELPSRWY